MSNSAGLCDRVARLFVEKMHLDIPSADTDLFETGALDSLAFVELLVQLEQEFGVKISLPELELDHFRSIAKIAEFVANGRGSGSDTAGKSPLRSVRGA